MSHFAEINSEGIVLRVIVAEQDFIDSGAVGDPKNWIQTSYNTYQGEHKLGGVPMRKNFAGIGYKYDAKLDAFIEPKPYESWVLDEQKGVYVSPKKRPVDTALPQKWDEEKKDWKDIKEEEVTDFPM